MSVYKKDTPVAVYPTLVVKRREPHQVNPLGLPEASDFMLTELTAQDLLVVKGQHTRRYKPGSVVSYSLEYNNDPIEAVEHALARRQPLHWINPEASVLSSHRLEAEVAIEVEIGMLVRFEGLVATIETAPNNNLRFQPL